MGFGDGHIHPKRAWGSQIRCHNKTDGRDGASAPSENWVLRRPDTKFDHYNKTVTCVVSYKEVIHYEWGCKPMNSQAFAKFLRVGLMGYSGWVHTHTG